MKIFTTTLDLLDDQTIKKMKNDDRVQFYKGAIWALESDVQTIQEQYNVKIHEGTKDLFFAITWGRNVLDLDLIFMSDMSLMEEQKELFYYNFSEWLKRTESMIAGNAKFLAENYKESERNYCNFLAEIF